MKIATKIFKLSIIIALLVYNKECKSNPDYTLFMKNTIDTSAAAKELLEKGDLIVHNPFMPEDTNSIEWIKSKDNLKKITDVINSNSDPVNAKFLAIMVLKNNNSDYFLTMNKDLLIKYVVQALLNNYTGYYSDWGFKGNYSDPSFGGTTRLKDEDFGAVGAFFLSAGDSALPELLKLLDNSTPVNYNVYGVEKKGDPHKVWYPRPDLWKTLRIKDFAALYISGIKNYEIRFDISASKRDEQISKMMQELKIK